MKAEIKTKFLQHLRSSQPSSGFTLIELLVVIIIIGILAAIALPSFLNQAAKAKQSEAKSYVGSVNRAQQSYRIEKPVFATDVASLEIGIPTKTIDYNYAIANSTAKSADFTAIPNDTTSLRAYAGGVMVVASTGQSSAAACQTTSPSGAAPTINFVDPSGAACAGTDDNIMR